MPLFGTLRTMSLPDLLQWLAAARMSGTLQVELNKVSKSISLEAGLLVGCSSEHPPERLGQFLLARGKLTEDQLRTALSAHEDEGKHLGVVLTEMGIITEEELIAHLEAQAEEIIFSLFDLQDAVFRFHQGEMDQDNLFPVCLRVEDVLLRGLKRVDEMRQIREVLNDPDIVLRYSSKAPPQEVFENQMARTLYSAIDGEKTVEEILLHVHGSEYIVTKFLFGLHRNGYIEISGVKKKEPAPQPVAEVAAIPAAEPAPAPEIEPAMEPVAEPAPSAATSTATLEAEEPQEQAEPFLDIPITIPGQETKTSEESATSGEVELLKESDTHKLERRLEKASQLMSQAEYESALEILDDIYQEYPGDESLRRLTLEAEAAFIEKAYRHYLPPRKIVHLRRSMEELEAENLSPTEFFLLSRIDGSWDLKSIVQIAPLREADALRTLKRMREKGMIELKDPA
jgi:hypothetical protein